MISVVYHHTYSNRDRNRKIKLIVDDTGCMRIFISADMEGITGIAASEDVTMGTAEYRRGQELFHSDVNAAIEGAIAAGATEVLVNDSHSSMRNLDRAEIDDRAQLIRGSTKPQSMMQGLSDEYDGVLFVGYHAKAGTANGVLNHTFFGWKLIRLRVNDHEVGELGWNARLAGALDVPVVLVTGDDVTAAEARTELGADVETVAVKRGIDRFTACCRPVSETRSEIRDRAECAVSNAGDDDVTIPAVEAPIRIEADWATTNQAARAAGTPSVTRIDGRTTRVEGDDYPDVYERSVAMLRAGGAGADVQYG